MNQPIVDETTTPPGIKTKKTSISRRSRNYKTKQEALNFVNWLMENCELAHDNSLWSYCGEDYTNEKLYKIFTQF